MIKIHHHESKIAGVPKRDILISLVNKEYNYSWMAFDLGEQSMINNTALGKNTDRLRSQKM